jgi:diguanylate cyclase (GGDEF)-like protein/PAS domain S-box-containing protein
MLRDGEKHLAYMEARYRGLLEAAPDAMLVVNEGGKIILMNAQAERQFGYHRDELLGQQVSNIIPVGFAERLLADALRSMADALAQQMGSGIELIGRRKDGSEFPIEIMLSPLESAEGMLVTAAIRNISVRKRAEVTLRAKELQLSTIYDNTYETIFVISVESNDRFRFISVNRRFTEATGLRQEQILGKVVQDIVPKPACALVLGKYKEAVRSRQPVHWEEVSDYPAGKKVGEVTVAPVFDAQGNCTQLIGTVHDITGRKEAEHRIAYLNRVYAMLSSINALIVHVHDRNQLFKDACRIAVAQGGFRMSLIAMVDQGANNIVPVVSASKDRELMTAITGILSSSKEAGHTMVAQVIRKNKFIVSNDSENDPRVMFGKKYSESGVRSIAIFPLMRADQAIGAFALYARERDFFQEEEIKLLTDLTGNISFALESIKNEKKLSYLAYYDVLTGLANRTLFLERLELFKRSAVAGRHRLAVFLVDLERFKNINDSLGRPAGDELLRQVATWLTRQVGDAALLARVGADQFAAVLPHVNQEGDVTRLVEKTTADFLLHPFELNDTAYRIAAKVGVALFPDDGTDADTLFKNAEAAVKKAKVSGDQYLFYAHKMTDTVAGSLSLENQLRHAVDNDEFVLHYQPKVHIANGEVTGAEALLRWNDPKGGLVPPERFIRILEDTGLIREVGRWTLRRAIAEYLRWRSAGLQAMRIAVNVSALQLRSRGFVAEIEKIVGVSPEAAAGLELEITESLIMEDVKYNVATLQTIRAMGVSIAIDDFGTGFSSLSYLSKLPLDTLKIDRSFVVDMANGKDGLTLVAVIINLARALKLKVVAEGVETGEQLRQLRLLNCDEMQGFLFSKPLPLEIFEARFLAPSRTMAQSM